MGPAVDCPHDGKHQEHDSTCDSGKTFPYTEKAHDEVCGRRQNQPGRHKFLYVAMIGQKAIDEFADCIGPVKAGSDDTKLGGIQKSGINYRLLHHIERCAAHII